MFFKRGLVVLMGVLASLLVILPAGAQSAQVYVSTQRFDSGLMIWRGDNSTIYVLADNGRALTFPASAYSGLPDNPMGAGPAGRPGPILGFGKVWGHQAAVRDLLGWPVLPEIGFETRVLVQNATVFVTELDQSVLQINPDGTWSRLTNPPTPPPPATCRYPFFFGRPTGDICPSAPVTEPAAFQPFERGFMVWTSGQGNVWVFLNPTTTDSRGHWLLFPESRYAGFADAAPQQPPPGRVQPVNGFGRVWHNLKGYTGLELRRELGWATAPESAYQATQQAWGRTSHADVFLSLPDGRVVDAYQGLVGNAWTWAAPA